MKSHHVYKNLLLCVWETLPFDHSNMVSFETMLTSLHNLDHLDVALKAEHNHSIANTKAQLASTRAQLEAMTLERRAQPTFSRANQLPTSSGISPSHPQPLSVVKPADLVFEPLIEGRKRYDSVVKAFFTTHGQNAVPSLDRPFPLSPGSLSPGSQECWTCGLQGHRKDDTSCEPQHALPRPEQVYRELVGKAASRAIARANRQGQQRILLYLQTGDTSGIGEQSGDTEDESENGGGDCA
jgi:hypothetical protein